MRRGHSLDTLMTLALFCLFAGSVVMVLMMGVESYQKVSTSMEQSYEERTCLQYIATKVAHYSGEGSVSLTQYGEGTALALEETFDGSAYVTYLYVWDGMAMEMFCEKGVDLDPATGFPIMDVSNLTMEEVTPELLRISCTGSGGTASVLVGLHNGQEVAQ